MHGDALLSGSNPDRRARSCQNRGGGTLDEPSKALLVAIHGTRSVADLGRQLGQGEFEISRAIFQLVQSGHVAIHPPRPSLRGRGGDLQPSRGVGPT